MKFLCNFLVYKVGTFQIRSAELIFSVLDYALAAGYRHIGKPSQLDIPTMNISIEKLTLMLV